VVPGRDGATVVDATVVVVGKDEGGLVLAATVVGAEGDVRVLDPLEHDETTATTATRAVAASTVVLGLDGPAMSGTYLGLPSSSSNEPRPASGSSGAVEAGAGPGGGTNPGSRPLTRSPTGSGRAVAGDRP